MTISLNEDLHVHSTFSDGRNTPAENLAAARELGLTRLGCVDHVRRDTTWVPEFVAAIRALDTPELPLLVGVEAKLLNEDGELDIPSDLRGVDRIYAADHRLPIGERCLGLGEARRALREGELSAERVVMALVGSTRRCLERHPKLVIAHLFSMLPKLGLSEDFVSDPQIEQLARTAREAGAWLEVDERWRCPGARVIRTFEAAGVPVVASSDAHRREAIGEFPWLSATLQAMA